MIIFGYRSRPKVLGQFSNKCVNCRHKTVHGLVKLTQWFTLYFIPLIPFTNKLFVSCGACGLRRELKGEVKNKMQLWAKQAKTQ